MLRPDSIDKEAQVPGLQAIRTKILRTLGLGAFGYALIAITSVPSAAAATLTLAEAIDRAMAFAPTVAAAAADSDFSQARVREMYAPFLPSVSAGVEYYQAPGYSQAITNRGLSSMLLTADYTAFDFGRRLARLRAARYANEAAMLGVQAARAQIVFDTKAAYYGLLRAHDTVAELQASLDRLNRYVSIIEDLQRTGRAIMNDVLKIRAARDNAELALAAAEGQRRRAAVMLGSLIGDFDRSDFEIANVPELPPAPSGSLESNPVLRAAARALASAAEQVKAADAARYPTVKLALTSGFLGIDPPGTINHNLGASYDGVVSVPVFQGGLLSARVDEARARQARAAAQERQAEYLLKARLSEARFSYEQARKQLSILDRAQPTADGSFALAWTRFLGGGNVTLLEVLSDYQQAERLRLARFDQIYALRQAAAQMALLYGMEK
jgi:outer membrane protein TolC